MSFGPFKDNNLNFMFWSSLCKTAVNKFHGMGDVTDCSNEDDLNRLESDLKDICNQNENPSEATKTKVITYEEFKKRILSALYEMSGESKFVHLSNYGIAKCDYIYKDETDNETYELFDKFHRVFLNDVKNNLKPKNEFLFKSVHFNCPFCIDSNARFSFVKTHDGSSVILSFLISDDEKRFAQSFLFLNSHDEFCLYFPNGEDFRSVDEIANCDWDNMVSEFEKSFELE